MERPDVLIVGAGMAGVSAALWCRRLGLAATWLEAADDFGGQLARINGAIPDYPGLAAADGRVFREVLRGQLQDAGLAPRLGARLASADLAARTVTLASGESLGAQAMVIATGAAPRRLGVPGEDLPGVSDSATRDLAWLAGRVVTIVGGGDAALENALFLADVCPAVTVVHRGAQFRAQPRFVAAVAAHPRVQTLMGSEVRAIGGEAVVQRIQVGDAWLSVDAVVVKIGVAPQTQPFVGQLALDARGYVVVDARQATSVAGVFAAGDVCNPHHASLAAAAGQGMVAVKSLAAGMLP